MTMGFRAVSADGAKIEAITREPALVWRLLAPDEVESYLDAAAVAKLRARIVSIVGPQRATRHDASLYMLRSSKLWPSIRRVMIRKRDQLGEAVPSFTFAAGERTELDSLTSWDAIRHCLQELVPASCPCFFTGGERLYGVDVGRGLLVPPQCFTPEVLGEIAKEYSAVSPSALLEAYRPAEMADVQPEGHWTSDDSEARELLRAGFASLCGFLDHASGNGLGAVGYVS